MTCPTCGNAIQLLGDDAWVHTTGMTHEGSSREKHEMEGLELRAYSPQFRADGGEERLLDSGFLSEVLRKL